MRLLAGTGLVLLVAGSLGLMAATAEAAAPPAASGQVLAAVNAAASPSTSQVTDSNLPTAVNGGAGQDPGSSNPAWPTWVVIGVMVLLIVGTMLFSLRDQRGSRQA